MPAEQPHMTLALALHPCSSQSGMGRKPSASHCPLAVLFMAPSTIWTTPACRQQLEAAEQCLLLALQAGAGLLLAFQGARWGGHA